MADGQARLESLDERRAELELRKVDVEIKKIDLEIKGLGKALRWWPPSAAMVMSLAALIVSGAFSWAQLSTAWKESELKAFESGIKLTEFVDRSAAAFRGKDEPERRIFLDAVQAGFPCSQVARIFTLLRANPQIGIAAKNDLGARLEALKGEPGCSSAASVARFLIIGSAYAQASASSDISNLRPTYLVGSEVDREVAYKIAASIQATASNVDVRQPVAELDGSMQACISGVEVRYYWKDDASKADALAKFLQPKLRAAGVSGCASLAHSRLIEAMPGKPRPVGQIEVWIPRNSLAVDQECPTVDPSSAAQASSETLRVQYFRAPGLGNTRWEEIAETISKAGFARDAMNMARTDEGAPPRSYQIRFYYRDQLTLANKLADTLRGAIGKNPKIQVCFVGSDGHHLPRGVVEVWFPLFGPVP